MSNLSYPFVIAGAGAAGIACALAASHQGRKVLLLEKSKQLGGTVTQSLIHTLGGLFDDSGELINSGLPVELCQRLMQASPFSVKRRIGKTWTLNVAPDVYAQVVKAWLAEHPAIEVRYNSIISHVCANARSIVQITVMTDGTTQHLNPEVLIDTTGQANVVRNIDASLVTDGLALAGFILQLRGVAANALQFPKGVALLRRIRKATENQQLPPECGSLWLDSGVYADEIYVKFNLMADDYSIARTIVVAEQLVFFLKSLSEFSNATIANYGQLGIRDGGRVLGEYTLTEADLKQGRQFSDAVCRGCWPIEYWHPQDGIMLDYFPSGHYYEIPLQALKVKDFNNLFVAGKCFSAQTLAQASTRVVGTCWAMGEGLVNAIV